MIFTEFEVSLNLITTLQCAKVGQRTEDDSKSFRGVCLRTLQKLAHNFGLQCKLRNSDSEVQTLIFRADLDAAQRRMLVCRLFANALIATCQWSSSPFLNANQAARVPVHVFSLFLTLHLSDFRFF